MKQIIGIAVGVAAGMAIGYLAASVAYKKKMTRELDAIRNTQQEIAARKQEAIAETSTAAEEPKTEEKSSAIVVKELSDEESDDDDDDEYDYFDSDELAEAKKEFEREVRAYMGNHDAYVISKAEYDEPFPGHGKSIIVIHENEDRAYDANTGEEIEDWREAVAYDEGTLDEDNADPETGKIYIRSERMSMDYEVTYATHDWVG